MFLYPGSFTIPLIGLGLSILASALSGFGLIQPTMIPGMPATWNASIAPIQAECLNAISNEADSWVVLRGLGALMNWGVQNTCLGKIVGKGTREVETARRAIALREEWKAKECERKWTEEDWATWQQHESNREQERQRPGYHNLPRRALALVKKSPSEWIKSVGGRFSLLGGRAREVEVVEHSEELEEWENVEHNESRPKLSGWETVEVKDGGMKIPGAFISTEVDEDDFVVVDKLDPKRQW